MTATTKHLLIKQLLKTEKYLQEIFDSPKRLGDKKLQKFCDIMGLKKEDGRAVYLTFNSIVLTSKEDFNAVRYYIKESSLRARIELPLFGVYIYAFEYLNDHMLNEALGENK